MAELSLKIKAEYESAVACREELRRVEQAMKKLNENSSPQEIERLTKRYAELTAKWENSMSFIGKAGAYVKEAFSNIGNTIKQSVDVTKNLGTTTKTIEEAATKRLQLEENILSTLEAQKKVTETQRNNAAAGLQRNKNALSNVEERLSKKYNGQSESFYDESDQKLLRQGREAVENWSKAWDDANVKVQVYDSLIEESTERQNKLNNAIEESRNMYKGFADTVESSSHKIFLTEDVFNRYHELSRTIEDLKKQIKDVGDSDDVDVLKLKSLQDELEKNQEEFRSLDESARHTAEVLGSDLAGRVENALNRLYDMNKAVRTISARYEELNSQLAEAKKKLAEAKTPKAITKAREEVDKLQVKLDSCSDSLSKFKGDARDALRDVENLSKKLDESGGDDNDGGGGGGLAGLASGLTGKIAAIAGIGLGLNELKDFFSQAKEWREYFQDIESSMKVFLGSAEKGAEFTAKLKDYAYYNMFEFSDLAAASQQMISYGHNVESVIPRLDQLSNVATGTHGSLMELVDTYNRAKATGVVDARGIQSWAVKGVMIRDVLRDMGEVTAGTTVTFEQLNKVLDHITGEGGQFHDLMLSMMDNISAESGQLEDNLAAMYSEVGEKFEGVFVKWLKLQSAMAEGRNVFASDELLDFGAEKANAALDYLLKNWQKVIDMVKNVVAIYGSYRAALIVNNALEKVSAKWKSLNAAAIEASNAATKRETVSKIAETAAESANTVGTNVNTAAKSKNATITQLLTLAQAKLNAAMAANPYAMIAAMIGASIYAMYAAYEGILTQEKAQRMQNDATETFNEKMEEQAQVDRKKISVIQDRTASLVEQTKAYKDLIAGREVFAKFSREEIANMSEDQISSLLSDDTAQKNEERIRNQVEAAKELKEYFEGNGAAWTVFGEDDKIDEIIAKYKLLPEYAEQLKNNIGWASNLDDYFDQLVNSSDKELQDYLVKEIEAGVVEGFKNGFSSPDVQASAATLLSDYSNQIKEKNDETEKQIAEISARIAKLRNGDGNYTDQERRNLITDLNNKIDTLKKNLETAREEIGKTFSGTLNDQIKSSEAKIEELNHKLADATGAKKVEIETQLKEARDERDSLKSILKLIEMGRVDSELVIKVTRQVENAQIGDDALVDIGEDYKKIDDQAQDFINRLEDVKKKYKELGADSKVTMEDMLNDAGLTAEGIDSDFENATNEVNGDIDRLKEKLENTKDDSEKKKLSLEIARKQEQLLYIERLKMQLQGLVKDPYNINVNVGANVSPLFQKIFDFFSGKSISKRAQKEGQEAQANIDAKKDKGSDKKTGTEWAKERTKALKSELADINKQLKESIDQKQYEELTKRKQQIESELKKGAKGSKEALQRLQRDYDLFLKNRETSEKQTMASFNAAEEARIAAIENATVREREARKNQFRLTEQSIKDQEEAFKKANVDLMKQEWQNKAENKTRVWAETATAQDVKANGYANIKLSEDQQKQIDAMRAKAQAEETRYYSGENKKRLQEMREYLKQYGDMQQQKLAIAEEYADNIRKAGEAGNFVEAESLRQKEKQEISSKEIEKLKAEIDWEGLFNNLDQYSAEFLNGIREKLQTTLQDPNIEASDKQVIAEKIGEIDKLVIEKSENTFHWINDYLAEQKRLQEEAARAAEEAEATEIKLNLARLNQSNAQQDVESVLKENGTSSKQLLGKEISEITSKDYSDIFAKLGLKEGSEQAIKLKNALDKLAGEEAKTAAAAGKAEKAQGKKTTADAKVEKDWKKKLAGTLGGFADDVNKYLGPLSGIADKLGLGDLSEKMQSGMNAVNSAAGAAASFASGDYLGAAMQGLDALSSFADTIGIDFGGKESDETYAEDMQRLTETNQKLDESINRLNKTIQDGNIKEIGEAYDKQRKAWEIQMKNFGEQISRSLTSYKSGGLFSDGESSSGYELYRGLTEEEKKKLGEAFGTNITDEVYKRTANNPFLMYSEGGHVISELLSNAGGMDNEDFAKIISGLRDDYGLWIRIVELAKSGHQDAAQYLEELADMGDKLKDIEQNYIDTVTHISFDNLKNEFRSSLLSMEKDATDTAGFISKAMSEALIDDYVSTNIDSKLKDWQKRYKNALGDETLTKKQRNEMLKQLQEEYQSYMDEAKIYADSIKEATGYADVVKKSQQQSATANSIQNISYDQADSLIGVELANQILMEQTHQEVTLLNATASQISIASGESRDIAADSRDILAGMAIHVEEIRDGVVDTIVPRIKNIDDNLNKVYRIVENQ